MAVTPWSDDIAADATAGNSPKILTINPKMIRDRNRFIFPPNGPLLGADALTRVKKLSAAYVSHREMRPLLTLDLVRISDATIKSGKTIRQ